MMKPFGRSAEYLWTRKGRKVAAAIFSLEASGNSVKCTLDPEQQIKQCSFKTESSSKKMSLMKSSVWLNLFQIHDGVKAGG